MSNSKNLTENKSYHGGIYIYFMNQKLLKAKSSKQTPSK